MKKGAVVMAIVLFALLLECRRARAAHQYPHQASWSRPIIATLLAGASQNVSGSGPEGKFLKVDSQGREADVDKRLDENPRLAFAHEGHGISAVTLAIYRQGPTPAMLILACRHDGLSLFDAAALGPGDVLESLLTRTPGLAKEFGPDGFTALHLASYFGHEVSIKQLTRAVGNIDAYSQNKFHASPLQSAAAASQLEAARLLFKKGANPNCRGDGGHSPLHLAAGSGQPELARLLLQHKADVAAKGDDGKTRWDVAAEEKQGTLLELLKKEGK